MLYVAALALAPLSLVQAVAAGGIGRARAARLEDDRRRRSTRREQVGVGAAVGGLVLLALSLGGGHAEGTNGTIAGVSAWLVVSGRRGAARGRPVRPRARAGRGARDRGGRDVRGGRRGDEGGHRRRRSASLFVPALLACHGCAFVAIQLAFQRGGALATAGVATLFTNALPIVAGLTLLHEQLPGGALGVLRLVAFAAVVLGAAALARPETSPEYEPLPLA